MAGLWHLSQQQIVDNFGKPIVGAKASFFRADTLTPISVYRDSSLSSSWGAVVTSDGSGRWPTVFLDDSVNSFYRFRVTTAGGVIIIDLDTLPIIGPGGGGGGGTVDPNALIRTGDVIWGTTTGARTGFVRGNSRTIGSAVSGATERANADTQLLYEHLWNNYPDATCPVSGGRGASAAADWAANKTIGVLDLRGTFLGFVDGAGNSLAGRITAATIATPDTIGSRGGAQTATIGKVHLPALGLSFTTGAEQQGHVHLYGRIGNVQAGLTQPDVVFASGGPDISTSVEQTTHTHGGTTENMGSGAALDKLPPTMLGTPYIKL